MTYDGRKEEEETSIVALLSVVAPFEVPLTPNGGELGSAPGLSFVHCAVHCSDLCCTEVHCCTAPVPAASPSVEYAAVGSTFVVPSYWYTMVIALLQSYGSTILFRD